jgi:4-hydroxy-2-oxoglutarate aldolase
MSKLKLRGVMPPMITPFKENGDVDYNGFASNMEKWNDTGMSGYLVLGSNSETAYLNEDEKLELIKIAASTRKPGKNLLVGSGMESLRETVTLTNKAAKLGCDAALVLTPSYYNANMTSEAMISFFTQLADNSDIPVLIYNVPKFTHINIKADAVSVLSKHPNIIGMKDSTGDVPQMATWKRIVPEDFNLLVGTASAWFPALTLGVEGAILALANSNPNECVKVQEMFDSGDWKEARDIYQRMFPVNSAVTATYGIAGLKYVCDKLGYVGGAVRNPLLPLKEDAKAAIDEILRKALVI